MPKTQLSNTEAEQHRVGKNRSVWANYFGTPGAKAKNSRAVSRNRLDTNQSHQEFTEAVNTPRTAGEKLMASIWVEILNLKQISVHDNFFDYGRDSYLAMEVVARVRKVFAVNLSVQVLFEDPTVAGMTAAVLKCQHLQHKTSSSVQPSSLLWAPRKRAERLLSKAK